MTVHFPRFTQPSFPDRPARFLIGIDLIFIGVALALAAAAAFGLVQRGPRLLGFANDHSLGNLWNISKWALVALIFADMWHRGRSPLMAVGSLVFLGVFLDDAFLLHEQTNAFLAGRTGTWAAHDVGVGTLAVLAIGAATLMALAWRQSAPDARRSMRQVLLLTLALVLTSGSLDWLTTEVTSRVEGPLKRYASFGIGLVEDGSELIFGSLILATALHQWRAARGAVRAL